MRRAVYPGTFDPITLGHVDVVRRGLVAFERIVVAVAVHPPRPCVFSLEERLEMVRETFAEDARIEVMAFDGLLVDFVRDCKARAILRGLRAVSDFEYEFQMATMNRRLAPEIETFFVAAAEECTFLSASLVRQVAAAGGDVSAFVPAPVQRRIDRLRAAKR